VLTTKVTGKAFDRETSFVSVTADPKKVTGKMTLETIKCLNHVLPGMESEGTIMEVILFRIYLYNFYAWNLNFVVYLSTIIIFYVDPQNWSQSGFPGFRWIYPC